MTGPEPGVGGELRPRRAGPRAAEPGRGSRRARRGSAGRACDRTPSARGARRRRGAGHRAATHGLDLLSLRLELVDLGLLVSALATDTVVVSVEGRPRTRADPTRLRQAIANLVANGLRHGSTSRSRWWSGTAGRRRREGRRAGHRSDARPLRARRERSRLVRCRSVGRAKHRRGARRLARAGARTGAGGRGSGWLCRPLPTAREAELRLERLGADGTARRIGAGSSTTVSPRSASTSERSHSSVLNVTCAIADLSVRARAPRSSFQRAIGGACQSRATAGSKR